MKYRIAWQSLITGHSGHGQFILDEHNAHEIAEQMNRELRGLVTHWIEPETISQ